jgi:hypothetical protein
VGSGTRITERRLNKQPDHIAKTVITLALGMWVVGIIMTRPGFPSWLHGPIAIAMGATIVFVVGFLILGESGWRDLSRAYPGDRGFRGPWRTCRSAVMAAVSLDDPHYVRRRVRLSFILRIGADERALHLSGPVIVRLLLPPISIPWPEIAKARFFEGPGWTTAPSEPGALVQAMYDPGYSGEFVELEIAQPNYFLQLPVALLKEALPRLAALSGASKDPPP